MVKLSIPFPRDTRDTQLEVSSYSRLKVQRSLTEF